jgi:serine protease inhibitor
VIYLKQEWSRPFSPLATSNEDFHLSASEVATMHRTSHYPVAELNGFRAIAIPFSGVCQHTSSLSKIEMGFAGMPGKRLMPKPFTVDRPFLFYITDAVAEAILFAGRISDPRDGQSLVGEDEWYFNTEDFSYRRRER